MPGKGARRRQRERAQRRDAERIREFEDVPDYGHVACADADLYGLDTALEDAAEVLTELIVAASRSRDAWPVVAAADEIRAVFEAVRSVAAESRVKLAEVRDRVVHFREHEDHLHVAAGQVVRMVVAGSEPRRDGPVEDLEDLPF